MILELYKSREIKINVTKKEIEHTINRGKSIRDTRGCDDSKCEDCIFNKIKEAKYRDSFFCGDVAGEIIANYRSVAEYRNINEGDLWHHKWIIAAKIIKNVYKLSMFEDIYEEV